MLLVDCETDETALLTTSACVGLSPDELLKFFHDKMKAETPDSDWPYFGHDCLLLRELEAIVGHEAMFDGVCYFHFTRVKRAENFLAGLVPGIDRLDAMWTDLEELLPQQFDRVEWRKLRQDISSDPHHHARLYRIKTEKRSMSGPFGQLIKKVMSISTWNGIHYLATPETIEDICTFFESRHDFKLKEAFIRATEPCVVKFQVLEPSRTALDDALQFVYRNVLGTEPDPQMPCYDAAGKTIEAKNILRFEFVPDTYGEARLNRKTKKFDQHEADDSDPYSFL